MHLHTGPVRRELRKLVGSPNASHRTHPERPELTGLMRRECRQNARTPDAEHRTHTGASGALCTPALQTPHWTLWTRVRCCQHQRPVRETLPRLLQISHRRNRKYELNFLKSAESCRACEAGGREEPKPLSTLGTPPPLQMCQHHQMYTTMSKSVSIFSNIYQKELASQLAMPLDPNTYAKLDSSSGTR